MAIRTIANIFDLIDSISGQQRGIYFTPYEKDNALDSAQKEFFRECYYAKDFEAIEPFKVSNAAITSNPAGFVPYPSGFEYFVGIFAGSLSTPVRVREVSENELPDAVNSRLRKISITSPIGVRSSNGWQLYPASIYQAKLTYYRTPATPSYAYTHVGRVTEYDHANSVQMEFREMFLDKIILKALAILGVSMRESDLVQFSQLKEKA